MNPILARQLRCANDNLGNDIADRLLNEGYGYDEMERKRNCFDVLYAGLEVLRDRNEDLRKEIENLKDEVKNLKEGRKTDLDGSPDRLH